MLIVILNLTLPSICSTRKVAVNDFIEQKVSAVQRWIYDIFDFFFGEFIGLTDVSPKTEKFVRNIQKEMKMEHITIRLRSFCRSTIFLIKKEKIKGIIAPFANNIFISENWFNSLPKKEKRAIIGHELAHIQEKHTYKKIPVFIICFIISCVISNFIPIPVPEIFLTASKFVKTLRLFLTRLRLVETLKILFIKVLINICCRHYELEADKISAVKLNNIDGNIDLLKHLKSMKNPYSRFSIKRFVERNIIKPIKRLISSKPPLSTRIKELEKLLEQNS